MDSHLVLLQRLLDALGVGTDISSKDRRKVLQKAVYLGQRAGVDLGHRFGWYINGPYSPSLARDYYTLASQTLASTPANGKTRVIAEKIGRIAALMNPPPGASTLSQADWLEAVASLDYARAIQRREPEDAREFVSIQKPHLRQYLDLAERALAQAALA